MVDFTFTLYLQTVFLMWISPSFISNVISFPQLITAILSCDTSCIDMEKLKAIYDNVSI